MVGAIRAVTGGSDMMKVVSLFLVVMAVLALFGRLRVPKVGARKKPKAIDTRKCPECGAFIVGKGPCPCTSRDDGKGG